MPLALSDIASLAYPLAGTGDAGRERVLDATLVPAVKSSVSLFLSEVGSRLDGDNASLRDVLARLAAAPLTAAQALRIPTSHLWHGMHDDRADPAWAAASVAAAATMLNLVGAWRASFASARRIRFGDALLPEARRIEVPASGPSLAGAERLATVVIDRASLWIADRAPSELLCVADPDLSAAPRNDIVRTIEDGLALIRTYACDYLPWIDRAIRTIVPIAAPPEMSLSRSVRGQHGIVYASFATSAHHMTEVLIHEASHQYFNFLEQRVFTADTLEDDALYWSPYVRKERTIDRILFAYHAFANVLLFHRRCLAGGEDPVAHVGNEIAQQEAPLAVLQAHLERSAGLTAAGRAIWEPLREQIGPLDAASAC